MFNYGDKSPLDFGGVSGGPVLLPKLSESKIINASLIGVIYMHADGADEFYARPLALIEQPLVDFLLR